jgi:OOP family OmpA-OmpF porin
MPLILLLFFGILSSLNAQYEISDNIVPNPDFELLSRKHIGWFYNGMHFSETMKYWNSPSLTSPDIYGPDIRVPAHWAEKGFGDQTPQSGQRMIGLTLYGCTDGKPHCREYAQIQLAEPLVYGQRYYVEMWVSPLARSLRVNNIGMAFVMDQVKAGIDTFFHLKLDPQIRVSAVVHAPDEKWVRLSGYFTAKIPANYLVIGNFSPDQQTITERYETNGFNYAYYYFDNILVKKVPPILEVPIPEDDLTRISLDKGKVIGLKDIFFDFDKYELLPRSFIELRKLLQIMEENKSMVIEVRGHTDSYGEDEYNIWLSRKRARSVVDFLLDHDVEKRRIQYRGFGEKAPIATNTTDEGRQLNRRVEFMLLEM